MRSREEVPWINNISTELLCILLQVTYSYLYSTPVQQSASHLFTRMLAVIVFNSDKFCGLVAIGQEGLEARTTVGREVEASGTAVSTIHGTSSE
jgi:hypothetical protein